VLVVLIVALLITYPWFILTIGTLAYLAALPFGWLSYRRYAQRTRESRPEPLPAAAHDAPPLAPNVGRQTGSEDRPPRLN
jgi:CDP-diacylglycerol--serine O-phosphatidyltransferase